MQNTDLLANERLLGVQYMQNTELEKTERESSSPPLESLCLCFQRFTVHTGSQPRGTHTEATQRCEVILHREVGRDATGTVVSHVLLPAP